MRPIRFNKRNGVLIVFGILIVCFAAFKVGRESTRTDGFLWISARKTVMIFVTLASERVEAYHNDMGEYPSNESGLNALLSPPEDATKRAKWRGPYLPTPTIPKDPWGQPYHYRFPGTRTGQPFEIYSFGPDRVESGDDIPPSISANTH
jgi:general secretion pathway protein G